MKIKGKAYIRSSDEPTNGRGMIDERNAARVKKDEEEEEGRSS